MEATTIEPKRMTEERRTELLGWGCDECLLEEVVIELLADAAYWRNAVKTANAINVEDGDGMYYDEECNFVGCDWSKDKQSHSPNCPWLLAQESD